MSSVQDFVLNSAVIWDLFQKRKLSIDDTREQLITSRCRGVPGLIGQLDFFAAAEADLRLEQLRRETTGILSASMCAFRRHPRIDVFLSQFDHLAVAASSRFKTLLFRGPSRCGKSQKAVSLFGADSTLCVNCQGLSPHLPSIKEYDRDRHLAILWDEVEESQVLSNKLVFQSPNIRVTLGQSACNVFSYSKWLHGTPQLLCSNTFSLEKSKGKDLPLEDRQWLEENIIVVELLENELWYLPRDKGTET